MLYVAPHVGAWIETEVLERNSSVLGSHPMWVRGLKQKDFAYRHFGINSRTPCGCVD